MQSLKLQKILSTEDKFQVKIKHRMSFLLKNSFNLKNFGANLTFIVSLKKKPTKIYKKVAPKVVDVSTINIPHHFPKTNPENTKSGIAKPKSNTQIMQKIKKTIVKNKKFSFLYFKMSSLFSLINS